MVADSNSHRLNLFLLVAPLFVLLTTRTGVEISMAYLSTDTAWIPSFIAYYVSIILTMIVAKTRFGLPVRVIFPFYTKPPHGLRYMFWGIIFPALLPLVSFVSNVEYVPFNVLIYTFIFSVINPFFEEGFWRGLLACLNLPRRFVIAYSAALFCFSHWFLWGYWFKEYWVLIPVLVTTFLMGLFWMWFHQKTKNLLYPILSHLVVDILNLSVGVYLGLVPRL